MVNDLYIPTPEMWKYVENTTMAETTERGCATFIQHDVDDLELVYMSGGKELYQDGTFIVSHLYELFLLDVILNPLYLRVTYWKKRNVSTICSRARRDKAFIYDKNRSAQAGIPRLLKPARRKTCPRSSSRPGKRPVPPLT